MGSSAAQVNSRTAAPQRPEHTPLLRQHRLWRNKNALTTTLSAAVALAFVAYVVFHVDKKFVKAWAISFVLLCLFRILDNKRDEARDDDDDEDGNVDGNWTIDGIPFQTVLNALQTNRQNNSNTNEQYQQNEQGSQYHFVANLRDRSAQRQ